jgi:hypothetical protein
MHKLGALTLLAASGCSTAPAIPVRGEVPGRGCQAAREAIFLGRPASAELGAEMIAATHAATIRWVPFGAMITMDYSPSRLTVRLDQQNRVVSLRCG